MKKQAHKLALRAETVRQLARLELPVVAGGQATIHTVICPSGVIKCNTTPNGGVQ